MMLEYRLFFEPVCTSYQNSEQKSNQLRSQKNRLRFKQEVFPQMQRWPRIKQFPLRFDFTFFYVKEYTVMNYAIMADWIIECMQFLCILQDVNPKIIAEITIRVQEVQSYNKTGALIKISKYEKIS